MTSKRDPQKPTLEDNPGLEHEDATPEGKLMTAEGSLIRDPGANEDDMSLDNDPGLEHDEATEAGRKMTAEGSTRPGENEDGGEP